MTLQGDPSATLNAAHPERPAILVDGARRVRVQGFTVIGGSGGIVGTNGARFDVAGCTMQNSTRFGVVSSYESTGTLDNSLVQNVTGEGVVVANNSSLVITDTTVRNNTGSGIIGLRGAHVRIGQDRDGNAVVRPVTITGNASSGVSITESSAGIVVGGSVSGNGRVGIFVGRGSSGQIGVGSGGLEAGVTIQSNGREGIIVEGANATIQGSTIGGTTASAGNARAGILVQNGGNARIGIRNDSSAYFGNVISKNGRDGITVASGGAALVGGNLINDNGQDGTVAFRFGVAVSRATANLVGGNTISNHPNSGVFVGSGGTARIGDPGFGLPVTNTISGNGHSPLDGTTRGGIFAFQGGGIEARGAIIEQNLGHGGQAFEASIIEIREGTVVRDNIFVAPGGDAGNGLVASLRSTLRLRDVGTAVRDNDGDGVNIASGGVVDFRPGAAPVSVTGNGGAGLRCVGGNLFYSGDVRGVIGNAGGGNADASGHIPTCARF
ncbi:MAG: right-handed parallel beta-helix repeat-containing protein [Gemmatimonadales bacterium]